MRYLITILFLLLSSLAFAINYPSVTWVDTDKHKIDINADGSITLNFVASATAPTVLIGYPSVTLIDTDSNKIDIDSDGCVNLNTN